MKKLLGSITAPQFKHDIVYGMLFAMGVAIMLRLLFAFPVLLHPERSFVPGDSERYHRLALNIAFKGRFAIDGEPYFLRPPAYPASLALLYRLFGADARVAIAANILMSAVTVLLIAAFTKVFFDDGFIHSALLFAINPLSIAMCAVLMSESLFAALICVALLAFAYGRLCHLQSRHKSATCWFAICGALIGIAALCRSVAVGLAPLLALLTPFACAQCRFKLRAIQATTLLFASLLVISPWVFRNRILLGRWLIDTNGQVALVFFASRVLSERYSMSGSEADMKLLELASKKFKWSYTAADASNLHIFCERHPQRAIQLSQVASYVAFREWNQSLRYYIHGCMLMWLPFVSYSTWLGTLYGKVPETQKGAVGLSAEVLRQLLRLKFGEALKLAMSERFMRYPFVTLLWFATLLIELCVYSFAIIGLWRKRGNAFAISVVIVLVLYFTLTGGIAGHFTLSRLRIPIEPLLCAISGCGLVHIVKAMHKQV